LPCAATIELTVVHDHEFGVLFQRL
jgi:hypothetical protein